MSGSGITQTAAPVAALKEACPRKRIRTLSYMCNGHRLGERPRDGALDYDGGDEAVRIEARAPSNPPGVRTY